MDFVAFLLLDWPLFVLDSTHLDESHSEAATLDVEHNSARLGSTRRDRKQTGRKKSARKKDAHLELSVEAKLPAKSSAHWFEESSFH